MYVICFYWQGDRWQQQGYQQPEGHVNLQQKTLRRWGKMDNSLPAEYINNLYKGVKKYASKDFKFICFTNELLDNINPEIEIRSFPMVTLDGVLPRLYMFSHEAGLFGEQVLCLDLDVVVIGNLEKIMNYSGMFCTRRKFKPGEEHKLDGDIMSFKACRENEERFWVPFVDDVEKAVKLTQGRERYWVRKVAGDIAETWDDIAPGSVVSYKWHYQKRRITKDTAIVSCHGYPRPHQIKGELKRIWNG